MVAPTQYGKNQFGEAQNVFILGGSNQIDINFVVDSTNGNGLGIRTLKGQGIQNAVMHTSATVGKGNNGIAKIYDGKENLPCLKN